MKVGVIINPSAGRFEKIEGELKKLTEYFDEIHTGAGKLGGDFIPDAKKVTPTGSNFHEIIVDLTLKLSKDVDVIMVIGGDGTANIVAGAMLDNSIDVPIMGVAAGTANVGPLIRFRMDEMNSQGRIIEIKPIEVLVGNRKMGYAFVDAVLGDTFLGTIDGKLVNLSVKDFLESGRKVIEIPKGRLGNAEFIKNGKKLNIGLDGIAQAIISPLHNSRFYVGKAITGALCWSHYFKVSWVLCVSNRVIIDSNVGLEELEKTVSIEHALFKDGDELMIRINEKKVFLILDGNPVCNCCSPILVRSALKSVKVLSKSSDDCLLPVDLECNLEDDEDDEDEGGEADRVRI